MFELAWVGLSATIAYIMSSKGYKKKSLSFDGAAAAFAVGLISFTTSAQIGLVLIAFFLSSSVLTRLGSEKKAKIEDGFKEGGERTTIQVISNSLPALVCSWLWLYCFGFTFAIQHVVTNMSTLKETLGFVPGVAASTSVITGTRLPELFFAGIVAHYACCCGDTWASEVGSLSPVRPRLITNPFREVPTGTNGGVSFYGLAASALGGVFIGFVAYITTTCAALAAFFLNEQDIFVMTGRMVTVGVLCLSGLHYVLLGAFAGLTGSLIDSLFGAVLQQSVLDTQTGRILAHADKATLAKAQMERSRYVHITGWNVLDNHQVNLLSATLTCVMAMLAQSLASG